MKVSACDELECVEMGDAAFVLWGEHKVLVLLMR